MRRRRADPARRPGTARGGTSSARSRCWVVDASAASHTRFAWFRGHAAGVRLRQHGGGTGELQGSLACGKASSAGVLQHTAASRAHLASTPWPGAPPASSAASGAHSGGASARTAARGAASHTAASARATPARRPP